MKFTCTISPLSSKKETSELIKALRRTDGVRKVKLNARSGALNVSYDEDFLSDGELAAKLATLGHAPMPQAAAPVKVQKEVKKKQQKQKPGKPAENRKAGFRDALAFLLCCFTVYLSFSQKHLLPAPAVLSFSVSAAIAQMAVMLLVWLLIGKTAFSDLKKRGIGMFTLASLGAFAAALYSVPALIDGAYRVHTGAVEEVRVFFDSAALIPMLITLGQMFENHMRRRAKSALGSADDDTAPMIRRLVRVTRVSNVLTLVLAIAAAVIWAMSGKGIPYAVNILVTVLVVACPGALELAVPAAFMKGLKKCADSGVIVSSSARLEALGRTDTVLFDRRSTICMDEAEVCGTTLASGAGEDLLISLAASALSGVESGEAAAVRELAKKRDLPLDPLNSIEESTPAGTRALIGDTHVAVGSFEYMRACTFDMEAWEELTAAEVEKGRTCLFVASHGSVLGFITIRDRLRESAAEAIARLKDMGIEVGLLTPERTRADEAAAVNAGIGKIITYEDSEISLRLMRADKKHVLGVYDGDECPDEPMMSGFMNYSLGSSKAGTPDVQSAGEDLLTLPASITCARRAISRSRRCLRVWLLYNLIAIAVAGGALYKVFVPVSPVLACACMLIINLVIVLVAVTTGRTILKTNKNA